MAWHLCQECRRVLRVWMRQDGRWTGRSRLAGMCRLNIYHVSTAATGQEPRHLVPLARTDGRLGYRTPWECFTSGHEFR